MQIDKQAITEKINSGEYEIGKLEDMAVELMGFAEDFPEFQSTFNPIRDFIADTIDRSAGGQARSKIINTYEGPIDADFFKHEGKWRIWADKKGRLGEGDTEAEAWIDALVNLRAEQ